METQYLHIAVQYYLAGRMAVFASSFPVVGNLFHHALEMFLKYFLLKYHTADELKAAFGHDLGKLWTAFKHSQSDAKLAQFDGLVAALNTTEKLRYPRLGYTFRIDLFKSTPHPPASGPAAAGLGQHQVCLEEIDEFVTALLNGRVNPKFFLENILFLGESKVQYQRENRHPVTA